jgi:hypothetical protein
MEGINSRPNPSQINKERVKTLSKCQIEPTKKVEKQERKEHKRDSQKHLTNQISEDTRRLEPPFPTKIIVSITLGH